MVRERVPGIVGTDGRCNVILSHTLPITTSASPWPHPGPESKAVRGRLRSPSTVSASGRATRLWKEVAAALLVRHDVLPYASNLVNTQLYPTSALLSEILNLKGLPKAVVGKNAFAHESGIHQHGVLANPLTYEIMTPASVGVTANSIVLGKHSGRRALEHRLGELGYTLSKQEIDEAYTRFTELADRKKAIYDEDLISLLQPEKTVPTLA